MKVFQASGWKFAVATGIAASLSVTSSIADDAASAESKPSMDAMRVKIHKKREERNRKSGSSRGDAAAEPATPPSKSAPSTEGGKDVTLITPASRTFLLASLANALEEIEDDGERSLLDAVLGFESEIETDDPVTRAGIEKARQRSGLVSQPRSAEAESMEWESSPTYFE